MFLLLHKCAALLMLLTATAAACTLPWLLARPKMASGVSWTTSVLQCLAAGVLLATGFTHMLPELREQIATSLPAHHHFPLAEVLVCVGMFAIYAIEELSELCAAKCRRRRTDDRPSPSAPMAEYEPLLDPGDPRSCYTSTSTSSSSCRSEAIGGASHQHRASSLILVAALCAHGVLEGSALGLTTSSQELWLLTAAIAMHKCLLGICVSQQLLPSSTSTSSSSSGSFIQKTTSLLALAAFCLASPLGGILSAMLFPPSSNHEKPSHEPDHNSSTSLTAGSILQAMATGTILYVVLLEILPTERNRTAGTSPVRGLANWAALVTGFTAMLAVTTFLH